ncbi:MAG: hypothetical protein WC526_01720 [Patescibacteria group bacterium]
MFEDQNPQANPPKNLPTEPVDMFAGVEKNTEPAIPDALSAGLLKKKDSRIQTPPDLNTLTAQTQTYKISEPIFGKVAYALIIAAIVVGLAGGGWFVYAKYFRATNTIIQTQVQTQTPLPEPPQTTEPTPSAQVNETAATPSVTATSNISNDVQNDNILFGNTVDSDKDGLSDARETQIGTDPQNPDTDSDGLSDGDEVLIWHTDPLKADTDGDSFPDGQEVRSGYDPLGPGKLFSVPTPTTSPVSTSSK